MPAIDASPPATRAEGLRRLHAFVPHAARDYAATRNYDRGPDDRSNVSVLSPYLRRRLVTEEEVVRAVVERHGAGASRKFVQEVCWRTYWKGALESRPAIWDRYLAHAAGAVASLSPEQRERYDAARAGSTGIAGFDDWARELTTTGYLHNHARMWFASIWIFTLDLPWELGAEFFLEHLLDGDPASNTLSWRWVAGLQTRGKTYLALRDNIRRYTLDRFDTGDRLSRNAVARREEGIAPRVPVVLPHNEPDGKVIVLIHDDDLGFDSLPLGGAAVNGVAALSATRNMTRHGVEARVQTFVDNAIADVFAQCGDLPTLRLRDGDIAAEADCLTAWTRLQRADAVVVPYAPVGPARAYLDRLAPALTARGLPLVIVTREWDRALWPFASGGFFALAAHIEDTLDEFGITRRGD